MAKDTKAITSTWTPRIHRIAERVTDALEHGASLDQAMSIFAAILEQQATYRNLNIDEFAENFSALLRDYRRQRETSKQIYKSAMGRE